MIDQAEGLMIDQAERAKMRYLQNGKCISIRKI